MQRAEYIFFCSHKHGDYKEFSNWYPVNYMNFTSSEKHFMYLKAIHFNDKETAEKILECDDPEEIKKLGRQIKNFSQEEWDKVKEYIMYLALYYKFTLNANLKKLLLSTGNKIIVEAADYDRIWGIGYAEENALNNINDWGQNLLGKALMKLRKELSS